MKGDGNRRKKAIPMNRFARPDEIAKALSITYGGPTPFDTKVYPFPSNN